MGVGVQFIRSDIRFLPIEKPGPIRTRSHTHPATDAPVVVDYGYAVRLLPGCVNRADFLAGGIPALLAGNRDICFSRLGNFFRIVIQISV